MGNKQKGASKSKSQKLPANLKLPDMFPENSSESDGGSKGKESRVSEAEGPQQLEEAPQLDFEVLDKKCQQQQLAMMQGEGGREIGGSFKENMKKIQSQKIEVPGREMSYSVRIPDSSLASLVQDLAVVEGDTPTSILDAMKQPNLLGFLQAVETNSVMKQVPEFDDKHFQMQFADFVGFEEKFPKFNQLKDPLVRDETINGKPFAMLLHALESEESVLYWPVMARILMIYDDHDPYMIPALTLFEQTPESKKHGISFKQLCAGILVYRESGEQMIQKMNFLAFLAKALSRDKCNGVRHPSNASALMWIQELLETKVRPRARYGLAAEYAPVHFFVHDHWYIAVLSCIDDYQFDSDLHRKEPRQIKINKSLSFTLLHVWGESLNPDIQKFATQEERDFCRELLSRMHYNIGAENNFAMTIFSILDMKFNKLRRQRPGYNQIVGAVREKSEIEDLIYKRLTVVEVEKFILLKACLQKRTQDQTKPVSKNMISEIYKYLKSNC